jgi:crotonobetainyl-CoA:carnitine CoA-transferase CaiB-like acyl-CoA transferase
MAAGALAGIRVLELANVMAGPFRGLLRADMGAEVIKVENPAVGDDPRTIPPFVNGEGAGCLARNRKAPEGKALFVELVFDERSPQRIGGMTSEGTVA